MASKLKEEDTNANNKDFVPREYQIEILEKAIKDNVIVYLPTGAGKTFIAVMLIKHYLSSIMKKYSEGGKRVYFLVNTTPLVIQHAQVVKSLAPVEVGKYTGDMNVDFWDGDRWLKEQNEHNVLVMTTQIYLDMILHGFTNLEQACLLIFDECHHAVGKHAMCQVMNQVNQLETNSKPKVFGLTATLLNCNVKPGKVKTEIDKLEATFGANVVRALNEEMVLKYSTKPNEKILYYSVNENCSDYHCLIEELLNKTNANVDLILLPDVFTEIEILPNATLLNDISCKPIKKVKLFLKDCLKISEELGLFGADVCLLSLIVFIERCKIVATDDSVIRILCSIETGIHLLRKKFSYYFTDIAPGNKPLAYATDKVLKLTELLNNFDEKSRAIIFVERRSTAHSLYHIFLELSKHNSNFKNIKPNYVVGTNQQVNEIDRENKLNRKRNNCFMKQFNSGELNVLFASNVIEEGVDIKACNLVVKFDAPVTFRSYTQSKGRARHKDSTYIIIAPHRKANELLSNADSSFSNFRSIEETLKYVLCSNRYKAEEESCCEDDDDENYEIINPYGSRVTALSAISLINRYCSVLPHDKFSNLTTLWWVKEETINGSKQFVGYLQLPKSSLVKELVKGIPRQSRFSAKRLVAFEAVKKLNSVGEFDKHFLPVGTQTDLLNDENLFPTWLDSYSNTNINQKKKLTFDRHYSKWECNSRPKADVEVYLHIIKISPLYDYPDTSRLQAFYNLLSHDSTLCILSTSTWPELPEFSLFMNVGEVKVEIISNSSYTILTEENMRNLKRFHKLLFSDALPLLKKYCVMDSKFQTDDYIIAPVIYSNNSYTIDWDTVNIDYSFPEIKPKPFGERLDSPVTEEQYQMKVVIPWYRQENYNLKYVVTKVRTDETPQSAFPSQNYTSYAHYFEHRYKQKIYDLSQPMLEVRAISSKINCLLPRAQYSSRRQKKEDDGYEETLVPELCYLITFPAWYLVKVTLLPSALHRVHHLLIAEELRQKITEETNLGSLILPNYRKWKELRANSLNQSSKEFDEYSSLEREGPLNQEHTHSAYLLSVDDDVNSLEPDDEEPIDIERTLNVDLAGVVQFSNFIRRPTADMDFQENQFGNTFVQKINKSVEPLKIINGHNTGYGPEPVEILEVLTAASSHDIINYERAELLGDSFLKFASSLALFTHYSIFDEGKLTQLKGKLIGNRNLFFCGLDMNLPGLIKVNSFDYLDWKVPGFSLHGAFLPYLQDPYFCSVLLNRLEQLDIKTKDISSTTISKVVSENNSESRLHSIDFSVDSDSDSINENYDFCYDNNEDEPSCRKVQNSCIKEEYLLKHSVAGKVVSDCVEALISVYLQNFGIKGGFVILNWLKVLPDSIYNIDIMLNSEPDCPLREPVNDYDSLLPNLKGLETSLGYTFQNKAFALQALTHSSHPHNFTDCYQRYEFLGDAILDFLLTAYTFEKCKDMTPGQLTELRSALVNNVTFACLSVRHRFHTHLLFQTCKLTDIITRFVKYQEARNHEIGHEVFYLINESEVQVSECIDVPKALGDIFESLIAAVYLDSGRDLNRVWTVVYNIMENEIKKFSKDIPKNPIKDLHETFTDYPPKFGKGEVKDGVVMIPLEVVHRGKSKIFHGIGENKYFAKIAASKAALKHFKKF